jgi:hypothetical protein
MEPELLKSMIHDLAKPFGHVTVSLITSEETVSDLTAIVRFSHHLVQIDESNDPLAMHKNESLTS